MPSLIVTLLYIGFIVGITIFVLTLLNRFVSAHERIADALDNIARKFRDDGKP
jgi:hypothetical protein